MQVVAQFMKEKEVFEGTVEKVNEDGTYTVRYTGGDSWNKCPGNVDFSLESNLSIVFSS